MLSNSYLLIGLGLYYNNPAIPIVPSIFGIILGIWLYKNSTALEKRWHLTESDANNTNNISH